MTETLSTEQQNILTNQQFDPNAGHSPANHSTPNTNPISDISYKDLNQMTALGSVQQNMPSNLEQNYIKYVTNSGQTQYLPKPPEPTGPLAHAGAIYSHKRGRPFSVDVLERNWYCGCGKYYLTYGSLYSHTRNKHGGVQPPGSTNLRRGRAAERQRELGIEDPGVSSGIALNYQSNEDFIALEQKNTDQDAAWFNDFIQYLYC